MRFQADIPGVGQIDVEGNFATDDSVQELIALMRNQNRSVGGSANIGKTLQDAEDGLASFSDELEEAEESQKKLTDRVTGLANGIQSGTDSMARFADSGGNMTDVMNSMAPVIEDTARGIGGLVPILGEGLEELAGAAATAAFGLATAAVGMIEGFIGLNKQLYNFNLMGAGGFEAFADAAETAQIPINEFASAMVQSTDKLRLFGSGAPGGIGQLSQALGQLSRDGTLANLYSLGFTTEEVVAGMADYAIAAERSGRALSTPELAAGSLAYLKNLRELARLTGVSVKEQQAEIDAQRANLFIQNQMLDMAPEQRAQAMAFAAAIPEALVPIKDFIVSGQSYNTESALMVSQMPTTAAAFRKAYEQIESGNLDASSAQQLLKTTLETNRAAIDAELKATTQTFGTAPDSIITEGDALGKAILTITQLMNAAEIEVPSKIAGGEESELNKALGNMEETINNVQSEVQQSLVSMTTGLAPVLNNFADGVDLIVTAIGDGKRSLETLFGESENPMSDLFKKLEDSIANAITRGFNNVIANTSVGGALGFKTDEQQIERLESLYKNLETANSPEYQSQYGGYFDIEQHKKTIQDAIDELEAQGYKLENMNYTKPPVEPSAETTPTTIPTVEVEAKPVEESKGWATEFQNWWSGNEPKKAEKTQNYLDSIEAQSYNIEKLNNINNNIDSASKSPASNNPMSEPYTPESTNQQVADMKVSLDESRNISDLVQLNRSMLQYMENSSRRLDEIQSAMTQANIINRTGKMLGA